MNDIWQNTVHKFILSSPQSKTAEFRKIVGKLLLKNGKIEFFLEKFSTNNQTFHQHLVYEDGQKFIAEKFPTEFKQLDIFDKKKAYNFRAAKKRIISASRNHGENLTAQVSQNREKNYILTEGMAIQALVDLGVFTADFKLIKSKSDKYKQINRFIEFVADAVADYREGDSIKVIDFGCGKSYLTFVVYYYLDFIKKLNARVLGLDLKADVINKCNNLAKKYNYDKLQFQLGDIGQFNHDGGVDMVITLHACDTATDYALFNAIKWGSRIILSVTCCQHELNAQFDSENFPLLQKYGIIKERLSALFTDNIRAELLRSEGYKTDLLEFVDFSHTPKNILIRAVKGKKLEENKRKEILENVEKLQKEFKFNQKLYTLLQDKNGEK
jgi:SAM-dependent methyltransferase